MKSLLIPILQKYKQGFRAVGFPIYDANFLTERVSLRDAKNFIDRIVSNNNQVSFCLKYMIGNMYGNLKGR